MLKKILGLTAAAAVLAAGLAACQKNAAPAGAKGSFKCEIIALGGSSFYVKKGNKRLPEGELITLSFPEDSETPELFSLWEAEINEMLRETAPPQGDAVLIRKISDAPGPVKITWDQTAALRLHLPERVRLIDVRSEDEYRGGHVPGAELLPLDRIEQEISDFAGPEDILIVYCRSGKRSASAAKTIAGKGFELVFDSGGILNYKGELE